VTPRADDRAKRQDRAPERLLSSTAPEAAARLLKTLHVMNADGSVSADMRRKLNQVNHLVGLFEPVLAEIAGRKGRVRLLDANCGNSYLSFLLYHHASAALGVAVEVLGIDRSPERIATCRARAAKLGYAGMSFAEGAIADAPVPDGFDMLVSLHGCDTASDDAIRRAVELRIPHVHVAPCCQKEVRGLLRPEGRFAPFLHDGIVAGEFAATLTDVIRALWLRTQGYRTEIVEFVPLEHSFKNRLIRAKFTKRRDEEATRQLEEILADLAGPPAILR
jgi:SAM-dependent methyltransferase